MRRLVCFFLCFAALGHWLYRLNFAADGDFEQLLAGSTELAISLVKIDVRTPAGRRRLVTFSNPESLSSLTEACRKARMVFGPGALSEDWAEWNLADFGHSFHADITLTTGRTVECAISIANADDRLNLSYPLDTLDDAREYVAPLPRPVPRSLLSFFQDLRR